MKSAMLYMEESQRVIWPAICHFIDQSEEDSWWNCVMQTPVMCGVTTHKTSKYIFWHGQ